MQVNIKIYDNITNNQNILEEIGSSKDQNNQK